MAQAVIPWLVSAVARVRSQVRPRAYFGGQCGTDTGVFRASSVSPLIPPMLHTHPPIYMLLLPEGQRIEPRGPSTSSAVSGIAEKWLENYCRVLKG